MTLLEADVPRDIISVLLSVKEFLPTTALTRIGKRCVQDDSYHCGPWVIEAIKEIGSKRGMPNKEYDILKARIEHGKILNIYKRQYSFSPSQKFTRFPYGTVALVGCRLNSNWLAILNKYDSHDKHDKRKNHIILL